MVTEYSLSRQKDIDRSHTERCNAAGWFSVSANTAYAVKFVLIMLHRHRDKSSQPALAPTLQ
jgi:hypothetical protein